MMNFTPFPNMETKNLILRRITHNDIHDLFEMRKDPRMHEHTDTKPEETIDETKVYIDKMNKGIDENKWIIWAMEHKESNKVIGTISIWNMNHEQESGELGYGIIPDYQGQGFMKEALLKVTEYGFDRMNLKLLEAYTEENNLKSIQLLKNCNFLEINRVEEKGYFHNRMYRMAVYGLENRNRK